MQRFKTPLQDHFILILTAFFLVSPPWAHADLQPYDFNLVAVHTSKCLERAGDFPDAVFRQNDCNGSAEQKFRVSATTISNIPLYQLEVPNYGVSKMAAFGTTNGSPVKIHQSGSGAYSYWSLQRATEGKWNLINYHSNRCLDISGWYNNDPAQIYDCSGNPNQEFYLEPVGGHSKIKALHSSKCLDMEGGSTANHGRLEQDTCDGSWSQQWKILPHASNPYGVIINRASGRVIDLTGGSTTNGTALQQYQYAPNDNQVWNINYTGTTSGSQKVYQFYKQTIYNTFHCWDIEGQSQAAGANAQIWSCIGLGQTNQLFTIEQ